MTAEDLSSYSAEWVEPISIDYRGWRVYELPPNGQGMAALEMLNIMETSPADPDGPFTAAEMHKRIEAMKLAYSDVYRYNADPRVCEIPVAKLLSKEHARHRAALIDPHTANGRVAAARVSGSDTTYLTVADREGNIVSWIQSIFSNFGSGITVEGMGFALQKPRRRLYARPRRIPTSSRAASGLSTPSSPASWSAATSISASASREGPISRSRMPSSFRTSSITE